MISSLLLLILALGSGATGGEDSARRLVQSDVDFQRPDAKAGAPIDVSHVTGIAFAPQGPAAGRLAIGRFVVSQ